jgi:anti-sigma factor (TIGR02949 family)
MSDDLTAGAPPPARPESGLPTPASPELGQTMPAASSAAPATARRNSRTATSAWVKGAAGRLGVTEATVRRWIRSGRLNPSCGAVYAHVFPYLDQELSPDVRADVERHLAACPGCEEHFGFDGAVLRFVRQRAPRTLIPSDLQKRLLEPFRGRPAPERSP